MPATGLTTLKTNECKSEEEEFPQQLQPRKFRTERRKLSRNKSDAHEEM
jgi:hypothetical protein